MKSNIQLLLTVNLFNKIMPATFWLRAGFDYKSMKKIYFLLIVIPTMLMCLAGCKNENNTEPDANRNPSIDNEIIVSDKTEMADEISVQYATQFSISNLEAGYEWIHVADGTEYILVPAGKDNKDFGIKNPVFLPIGSKSIYLAASSVMDLFLAINSLDAVTACSTKASDYSVDVIREKIDSGIITYIGKYSSPDYEALLSLGCDMAIESTMIGHAPKVREQIESLSIPIFVDRSSYEESPLGRLEWIKVYGALLGKEVEAKNYFDAQVDKLRSMEKELVSVEDTEEKSVAFFSITSNGYVNVHKPGDYICKTIEIAGGQYALNSIMAETNALSTVNINWEDFYVLAKDADIIIYNGTIDGGLKTVNDLVAKNPLFADFKAVKEGNVYGTSLNMYQESSKIIDVILDINKVIIKKDSESNRFILPLDGKSYE